MTPTKQLPSWLVVSGALLLTSFGVSCAHKTGTRPFSKVVPVAPIEPIHAYRAYATLDPARDKAVLAKADAVGAPVGDIRIFQGALPVGIALHDGLFIVTPGYPHQLLGTFVYSPGKLVSKVDLVARVKRLATAAGGDSAIVTFLATDATNDDIAEGVDAVIVKLGASPGEGPSALPVPGTTQR